MRIGIVGDVHWSKSSSIIPAKGDRYSLRLTKLIDSVNYAEHATRDCDFVVYLGDFFDRSDIEAEEMTALKEVCWNFKQHYLLVGNHEVFNRSLEDTGLFNNTARVFDLMNFAVFPEVWNLKKDGVRFIFLPYQTEKNALDLNTIPKYEGKTVIFSHNDLQIRYGAYLSTSGYSVEDIEKNCDLFINGHIHNFSTVGKKIVNLGNLTGQNFGEDALIYPHRIAFLDTDTMELTYEENPYAFNFYKISTLGKAGRLLPELKDNALISITCSEEQESAVRKEVEESKKILASRVIVQRTISPTTITTEKDLHVEDHREQFVTYVSTVRALNDDEKAELALLVGRN